MESFTGRAKRLRPGAPGRLLSRYVGTRIDEAARRGHALLGLADARAGRALWANPSILALVWSYNPIVPKICLDDLAKLDGSPASNSLTNQRLSIC